MFINCPVKRWRGALAQARVGVKEPAVLVEREAVGHAGDVVGRGALRPDRRAPAPPRTPAPPAGARHRRANSARTIRSASARIALTCGWRYMRGEQERLDVALRRRHRLARTRTSPAPRGARRRRSRRRRAASRACVVANRVLDEAGDDAARQFVDLARLLQPRMQRARSRRSARRRTARRRRRSSVNRPARRPSSMSWAL